MKLFKTNKFKSLLLAGALSLSLFFGGCSSSTTILSTITGSNTTQDKNDNYSTSNNGSVPKGSAEASVERVVDGDTMKVKLKDSGKIVTLRLLLIDTPESVKPGVDPQPYSIDASNFAKGLLQVGDKVYIEYDHGDKTDKYDRHLCYLWFYNKEDKSWKMFNEKIVEEGLARVGYVYSQRRHLDTLYKAQDKAKASKLNIWSVNGYVTDKGFDVDTYNNGGAISSNSSSSNNTSQSNLNETVYANGGNSSSNKYHSSEHAHGMKGAIKITELQAKSKGYKACGLCY
ncbi:thermonuclease family protein [Terrisporobacter mayombei]|uniref:SPbeta prophage-derived endonuclease YokF n=1 Tax=Terrisporobacter mayombei TaxID=1541 RepID=A0ABY9PX64_9FIRM|nr:thermonuclease family protein [Terrisporobacter mayombei]MCC3869929.1 thermonuclease family protein [Terrisporobacter mayombei]WMT79819.1 SPbeta prophage-derived endonuclease YokF [Terrisporobacter mayombei]